MNSIWSNSEKQFIKDNANNMKDIDLAARLSQLTGRTVSLQSVRKQRQKMGIVKNPGRGICGVKGQPQLKPADLKVVADNKEKDSGE